MYSRVSAIATSPMLFFAKVSVVRISHLLLSLFVSKVSAVGISHLTLSATGIFCTMFSRVSAMGMSHLLFVSFTILLKSQRNSSQKSALWEFLKVSAMGISRKSAPWEFVAYA